ncbi:MAG: ACT domain-containing protein [Isosphaeraceae bacterium]|nr:ACT domain-containing protein [Isosphaeraceae bacterium]
MEFVREITAHLENKPGRLAKICSALAHEKVNIRALTVMDGDGPSVLRIVADQVDAASKVLTSLGTEHTIADRLSVSIDNRPGALAKLLEHLAEAHINIEYAYASTSSHGRSIAVFHTSNSKKAQSVLNEFYPEATTNGAEGDHSGGRRPLHSR